MTRSRARADPRAWATRAAAAVAVAAGAVLVRQLYTAGAPLLELRRPAVYPVAIAGALAAAAWGALRGSPRAPVTAAALALALYLSNGRLLATGDTAAAALVPYNLVRHGSPSLDGLVDPPWPAWVEERGGRLWSHYPITAAVLALPVYLPAALGRGRPGGLPHAQKLAAALIAAASVGFVLATLRRAGAPRWLTVAGTCLYAAGSSVLSVASQALWQHGPGVLAVSAALWAALRARQDARFAAVAGACCGLAVAARPTDALIAAALLVALGVRSRPAALRAAVAAAVVLAPFAAYQAHAFGSPLATGYGAEATRFTTPLAEGLRGVLVSPAKGLLAFTPWAALGLLGLLRGGRRDALYAALAVAVVADVVLYARWHDWWGGWCYGPRLLCDLMPVLTLGLVPLAAAPRALGPALAVTGAFAVALHGAGAFAPRSPVAAPVYEARDGQDALEGWRWPPAAAWRALSAPR